jgi:hypothetical protein
MKIHVTTPCACISIAAILLSVASIAHTCLFSRLGKTLAQYDLSTPRKAVVSFKKMNCDLLSAAEFGCSLQRPLLDEYLKTLEVKKEVEFRGNKLLFVSFSVNGVKKFKTEEMEKDTQTGFWVRMSIAKLTEKNITFTQIADELNGNHGPDNRTPLQRQIDRWEKSGEL